MPKPEDIDKLLAVCAGSTFNDVRDRAIILVLRSTVMRRNELVQMRREHVDLSDCTVYIPKLQRQEWPVAAQWYSTGTLGGAASVSPRRRPMGGRADA